MRTPRSLLRQTLAVLMTAVMASTLLSTPAYATGTLDVNLTISSTATCTSQGEWIVRWRFHSQSQAMHHIANAHDPVNGVTLTAPNDFNRERESVVWTPLPGTATTAAVTADVTRAGQAGAVEYGRTLSLGEPCVPESTEPPTCANHDDVRFRHTFDAATGRATVAIVDKPLCDGMSEFLMLMSDPAADYTHDDVFTTISSSTRRVVTQVGLPRCTHVVSLSFATSGDDTTLGSTTGPGSRSAGPYARSAGGTGPCTAQPTFSVEPKCNGDMAFRLGNGTDATRHAIGQLSIPTVDSNFFAWMSATPGETYEVVSRHDDRDAFGDGNDYDTVTYRMIVGGEDTRHQWRRPLTCPLRHNDISDDNRSDLNYLTDTGGNGMIVLYPVQTAREDMSNGFTVGHRSAYPLDRVRAVSGDFSGDHRMDLAAFRSEQSGRVTLHRMVSTSVQGVPTNQPITQVWDSGVNGWWLDRMHPVVGDFDADGHEDIAVFYRYDNARTALWIFNGTATGINAPRMVWDSGVNSWNAANSVPYVADVDGDGKTDVGAMYRYTDVVTGAWNWLSNGTTFAAPFKAWQHDSWSLSRSSLVTGDFNGDGKGDVATLYRYADWEWKLWTMTGRDDGHFDAATVWYTHPKNWADPTLISLAAGDFNGDGKADVGYLYRYPTEIGLWRSISSGTKLAGPAVAARRPVGTQATVLLP